MKDSELLALNKIGFIPGPDESESDFLARVDRTKKKFVEGDWIAPAHWDYPRELLDQLFHVKPLYICAFYSKQNLLPWEGAATWIEGNELHSIQLRKNLWLYNRSEILAHEAVHAARCAFNSPRFEEFFAYMTSEKKWRRALGPIIRHPWEAWPFLISLCMGIFFPVGFWVTTLWLFLGFFRLIKGHQTLNRAALQIAKESHYPRAVLFRMTDEEIQKFADGETIANYGKGRHDLRWKIIQSYIYG